MFDPSTSPCNFCKAIQFADNKRLTISPPTLYAECMIILKNLLLSIFLLCAFQSLCGVPLADSFRQAGYVEICDTQHGTVTFDALYASFDTLVAFLQAHPTWKQKLYGAKERFIRSKERSFYSTDFFGLHDESQQEGRSQIAFYYSIHFHTFLSTYYPEFNRVPEIADFLQACHEIQQPYADLFVEAANELGLTTIFSSAYGRPPILLKVMKYFPAYHVTRPHYDGTVFSLFLDSTDNRSLLLAPYTSEFVADDFHAPDRTFPRNEAHNSILLIPGAHLTEFSIYPTPHIVAPTGNVRYATIAFAMRPHYISQKNKLSALPNLNY